MISSRPIQSRTYKRSGDAVKIGGIYELVTPVTGAVVLESKQQSDQAGLKPVDSHTLPTVPEPGTILLLLMVGVTLLYLVRRRQRALRG